MAILDIKDALVEGYIDHEYKGKKLRLYGQILAINEGDNTARMKFENGYEDNGIPLEAIVLSEGAIDKIKSGLVSLGSKAKEAFRVIGGFCKTMWNGIVMPVVNSVMIGQLAQKNLLPAAVGFYPSSDTEENAKSAGVSIASKDAEVDDYSEDINGFWRKIVDSLKGKANESGSEIIMSEVKEAYLKAVEEDPKYGKTMVKMLESNPSFNKFFSDSFLYERYFGKKNWEHLLEYTANQDDKAGIYSYKSENIPEMSLQDIVRTVMTQLKIAFNEGEFDWADKEMVNSLYKDFAGQFAELIAEEDPNLSVDEIRAQAKTRARAQIKELQRRGSLKGTKPLMIWGAPGIGKTSIIQQTRSMFTEATGGRQHINMIEVVLSKMEHDDFGLPSLTGVGANGEARAEDAPQSWLPIWKTSGNAEEDKRRNQAANLMGNYRENFDFDSNKGGSAVTMTNDKFGKIGADTDVESDNAQFHQDPDKAVEKDPSQFRENGTPIDIPETGKPFKAVISKIDGETYVYQQDGTLRPNPVKKRKKLHEMLFTTLEKNIMKSLNEGYFDNDSFDLDNDEAQESLAQSKIITDGGIIFFDELTRAKKGVMNVIMNLINDRKYGEGWQLGSHWIIVCAGNRFYEMPGVENTWEEAFGTRFLQMTYVPQFEDWVKWAQGYDLDPATGHWKTKKSGAQRIDQDILDFLISRKSARGQANNAWYESREDENVDKSKASKIYANPRSWETASNLIYDMAVQAAGGQKGASRITPRGEYYNLSISQKLKALAMTIGMGNATYGGFGDYHNSTKFFKPDMIDSIWKYGTITGKRPSDNFNLDDYVPKREDGRKASIGDDMLQQYAKEVLEGYPNDWKKITSQELCNMASYFIKILKHRHADQSILKRVIIPHMNKFILANGVDEAKGIKVWGSKQDKAYVDFILPLAKLVLAFDAPGSYDPDQKASDTVEEYVEDVKDQKGDKVDDLIEA